MKILKRHFTKMNFRCKINCTVRLSSNKPGLVLVSTGVLKLEKPSAGRDRAVNRNLKINADNNKLAYAA